MKIAGATVNQVPMDWDNNTRNIIDAIGEARRQQVAILCLPELSVTGYGCEDLFLSDWLAEKAWEEVLQIRAHCMGITVSVGLPVRIAGITYNGACVISDGKILGITFKQYLARDGVHYEPRWFDAWPAHKVVTLARGEESIPAGDLIYDVAGIKMGFEICEDGWRKDLRPGYRLRDRGVDLILNPSASHFAMGKSTVRERDVVQEGSSLFACAYLFTNLLGNEAGRMIYDGDIILAQHGRLLAVNKRFSFLPFNILVCDVNFRQPAASEVIPSTDTKERNEELTRAVALALFDYVRKSRAKGFVLSLSGGADSSACAVFVAEMVIRGIRELGAKGFAERVGLPAADDTWQQTVGRLLTCAYQGTRNSSTNTYEAARVLAASIGAVFHSWTIDDTVTAYTQKIEQAIGRTLTWEQDDITLQNVQARTRSPIIWMLANIHRAVLLTTSNRSEGDVGYATMDGDTSGSLAPIAGLTKVFVLQWLRWAQQELGHDGLYLVNNLQPTAELRPLERHQTDEADLMPYAVLAEIERWAIQERKSPVEVYHHLQHVGEPAQVKAWITKFFRLWSINQWKRERIAPAFHLDDINVDPRTWCRFPILSSGFARELQALERA
ncbi:NAD(+) synthase [Dawidia soli]|uniref:Glutamine-dependent NAD(+) synthetase n=1 Tax=Dawidia soli TaxID=2782352 RepID=A0AAP2DAE7_9BACT|nr:NAD(+) synthase [Dawidia soli]MBT1687325.1 NAD(+) synthase [Dawidia soli]